MLFGLCAVGGLAGMADLATRSGMAGLVAVWHWFGRCNGLARLFGWQPSS